MFYLCFVLFFIFLDFVFFFFFFFSSRRRHTRWNCDWSSDVCSSDLLGLGCPTWPQCVPGSYTPVPHQAEGWHRYVEFGNRTLTSVVGVAALLAVYEIGRASCRERV